MEGWTINIIKDFKDDPILFLILLFPFFNTLLISNIEYGLKGFLVSIFLSILLLLRKRKLNLQLTLLFLTIFIISTVYLFKYYYIASFLKYIIYLGFVLILSSTTSIEKISKYIISIIEFIIPFFLILFFLKIGVDHSYGSPRMQGLMSEPSALAFPITILFLYYLFIEKSFFKICVIGLPSVYLSKSPTVVLVLTTSVLFYAIIKFKFKVLFLSLFSSIIFLKYYEVSFINRLIMGINYVFTLGESGYNPRAEGIFKLLSDISETPWIFLWGRGLNSAAPYYTEMNSLIYTFNIQTSILFFFGISGLILFLFLLIFTIKKNYNNNINLIVLIGIIIYTSLNSAMGITIQYVLFIFIYDIFKKNVNWKRKELYLLSQGGV